MEKQDQLLSILKDLENKAITTYQAGELILILFDVSGSFSPNDCDIDITRCPKCKSPDHSMITGQPYKCRDCGNVW